MRKNVFIVSFLLSLLTIYALAATAKAAFSGHSRETAAIQSSYSISFEKERGIIYDRKLEPLTNTEEITYALCLPTDEVFRTLKFNGAEEYDKESLSEIGLPFRVQVSHILDCDGITYYESSLRHSGLCSHLLGHLTDGFKGADGIEKLFDNRLAGTRETSFTYSGDAFGRPVLDEKTELNVAETTGGIALCIDRQVQSIAEDAANRLDRGAVIVMECGSGDILAMVSRPGYDPNNVEEFLRDENSALLDRCFEAYAPGSVFKLAVAAAILESGLDPKEDYVCSGNTEADGLNISCYGGKAHGKVNLHTALQNSCNCYFISMAERLDVKELYSMALQLGLGAETELYPGLSGAAGSIGSIPLLENPRALANFAIGQGELLMTPLQAAAMVNCIASNGVYTIPNIFEGFVEEDGSLSPQEPHGKVRVMEALTAGKLRDYMESAVKFGTGRAAFCEDYVAGAKTGTAQTGVYENGTEKLNYWFCGYAGKTEAPEYVITVLREGAADGSNPCPEIFRLIAEKLLLQP